MNIVNLIDAVDPVSVGVWKAAVWTAETLSSEYRIATDVWAHLDDEWKAEDYSVRNAQDVSRRSSRDLQKLFTSRYSPSDTIVVSHGTWQFPTKLGAALARRGYPWVYVPQGMLEPWSMKQNPVRKNVYWRAIEGPCVKHASVIRAVSSTEQGNLDKLLPAAEVRLIPNGIKSISPIRTSMGDKTTFLFLGRLHKKKGVAELAEAFCRLPNSGDPGIELIIAGPDQGELVRILQLQNQFPNANVKYVGPVYGDAKKKLLLNSSFFVLPSHSEGFPTSVIEAMGSGCIPILSDGCNFPEAERNRVCLKIGTTADTILPGLKSALGLSPAEIPDVSIRVQDFIQQHYTVKPIAAAQARLIGELAPGSGSVPELVNAA